VASSALGAREAAAASALLTPSSAEMPYRQFALGPATG
jgi:hypothetical protein